MTIPAMHVDIEPTREGAYLVTLTSDGTCHYMGARKTLTRWGARRVARAMLRQERKYWTTSSERVMGSSNSETGGALATSGRKK